MTTLKAILRTNKFRLRPSFVVALWSVLLLVACDLAETARAQSVTTATSQAYIATYGDGDDDGIYLAELASETGQFRLVGLVASVKKASFIAMHPTQHCLYVACEVGDYADSNGGGVSAFGMDAEAGKLTLLNSQSSRGANPCFLSLDPQGEHILVANYDGGTVSSIHVGNDGRLGSVASTMRREGAGANRKRQNASHPHAICLDRSGNYAFVPDLGLDEISIYRFDKKFGGLSRHTPNALAIGRGAGPRHIAFHPHKDWAYVINELDSTVAVLKCNTESGGLEVMGTTSTLPKETTGDSLAAEIVVTPDGKYLYASNRGNDSLAMFAISQSTGQLTSLGHHSAGGSTPVSLSIDPTGKFLLSANQHSACVVVHEINLKTGMLSQIAQQVKLTHPVCIRFAR